MGIIHESIKDVKDVARHNRGEGHTPPILTKAVDPKSFSDEWREDSEQESISKTRQSWYELEISRVFNADCTELRGRED
jgi:hypothetical protein